MSYFKSKKQLIESRNQLEQQFSSLGWVITSGLNKSSILIKGSQSIEIQDIVLFSDLSKRNPVTWYHEIKITTKVNKRKNKTYKDQFDGTIASTLVEYFEVFINPYYIID
jgi:hypothetical protein